MATVRPMKIRGHWAEGFVLDFHTIRSDFVGHDEFGHPVFDTQRTELGELLYRLKYGADRTALDPIVRTVVRFVREEWNPPAETLVATPPSRVGRRMQPVLEIAKALSGRLKIPLSMRVLVKTKETPELKSVHDYHERIALLEDAYTVKTRSLEGKNVLLVDDLYRSGATLNAISLVLQSQSGAARVYVLALTRTRSKW